ncbi:MAG: VWA domain-containing protein, partial [Chloroflexi bacterium]|nr:VWA domain-containing protein [Chloroflexota bacterium]
PSVNEFLGWAHTLATTFRFARPWWLLLLAVLPWFWWIARPAKPALPFGGGAFSAGPGTSLGRARSSTRNPGSTLGRLAMRSVIVVTTVLGLAGLTVASPVVGVATVFLIDTSASIPADVQAGAMGFATAALDARGPDDLGGIVTFARGAHIDTPLGHRDPNRPDTRVAQVGVPETVSAPAVNTATNLEDAISTGAALLPPPTAGYLRRLVLLSDGNETTGSARSASRAPALVNVEIATYSVPGRLDDAAIASFVVAPTLHDGDDAEGRISIISPSPITASLKVWARAVGDPAGSTGVGDRGTLVFDRTLDLDQGPAEIPVALGRLSPGAWAFAAELSAPADALPDNNMAWAHTLVSNPARVLVVEGSPDTATALRRALGEARILTDVVTPDGIPGTAQGFANFDAILLVDVPTTAMTDAQMTAIREAVSSDGGEYAGTPLEDALPVTVQLPEKDQASTLAIVIVIDRSGSMSGIDTRDRRASRMDLAKEGATLAIETLREGDQIGVVAFDYNARWVSEIRPLRGPADFKTVADRIATIQPDGGTDIYAALDVAYRGLQTTQARVKHVILLTDGEGTPAPFPNLLNAYRRANITLSTVGVSSEAGKSLLQDLARRGSGRYYFTDTPSAVPQIMTQEARLAGRAHKQERDFKPRLAAASSAVRGLV